LRRPPQMRRVPRHVPLSRACGARPARETIRRRQSEPSSASWQTGWRARWARCRGPGRAAGLARRGSGSFALRAAISRSSFSILWSRRAIMLSMSHRLSRCPALWRRTFSALRASTSCLRRRRKSASRALSGSGGLVYRPRILRHQVASMRPVRACPSGRVGTGLANGGRGARSASARCRSSGRRSARAGGPRRCGRC
jgi:hypothetical protein